MEAKRAARAAAQTANAASSSAANTLTSMHSIGSSIGSHKERSGSYLSHLAEYDPEEGALQFAINAAASSSAIHPLASMNSIGSSIGSHKESRGSHLAEYYPEEGAIKFAISESVKSLKLTIDSEAAESENEDLTEHATNINESPHVKEPKRKNFLIRFEEATYKQNLEEQCFRESKTTEACWQNAAKYDCEVEQLFTYVQVFTASLSSFAHGANDIANAIAPVAAIIDIYQNGTLNPEAPVQKWILAYGGVALSLGLLLYGYKVMKTIGYKLTALSPTRGSSASLASALVVATASYIGIPALYDTVYCWRRRWDWPRRGAKQCPMATTRKVRHWLGLGLLRRNHYFRYIICLLCLFSISHYLNCWWIN